MKDYRKIVATVMSLGCFSLTLTADICAQPDDFAAETVEHFNHEGYQDASMEDDCQLQQSFDVAECDAFDGCNILDAAAAKASFASQRYLKASVALKDASVVYKKSGYSETAKFLEEAARVAESGHLAFASLSAFDAAGVEAMNVSNYEDLKEMFLHIDPIYLDASKSSAKAFASVVGTDLLISEVVEAAAYNQSATAAAFRAYQFFYAGIDSSESLQDRASSSWTSWFWEKLGY